MSRYIIGVDQSTSGTTVILIDDAGEVVAVRKLAIKRYTPQLGWVEQDATEIWLATRSALRAVIQDARVSPDEIESIGIANQRETIVVWDRHTGEPSGRAIGWQDRRTLEFCEKVDPSDRDRLEDETGMLLLTNSAGPKIEWLLSHDRNVQRGMADGRLICGTVDSWLMWNLSGGKSHVSDHSNASVTMLQDARTLSYSERAIDFFGIPRGVLPALRSSSETLAYTAPEHTFGVEIPITGCAGDQQASMFGVGCIRPGMAKNTYGAGNFTMLNVGDHYQPPSHGTFSPVLWSANGTVTYGVEYMTDDAGSVLDWLRDGLRIIGEAREAESLALQVPDSGGLHFIPSLGQQPTDRRSPAASRAKPGHSGGLLMGLTHQSTRQHIARAALEAIAFQARDALEAIQTSAGISPAVLRVDGAGARNDFLMQFQADILGIPVERPRTVETTAVGAAYLAGLAVGFWDSVAEVEANWRLDKVFEPRLSTDARDELYQKWVDAMGYSSTLNT
ncbi:FGGY family carbohydrate kinase [Subtercola frigoramans]|uniref:ATP:glycerol 3-phosphotransferase n=1 Tax=Subtercola frigoramans TaxID=120298 RepID=A0ABS2LAZ8_9MICO|nr:glycerol kinase GlpK [Subtercola frigoramans]MBM7473656.1 glycerol kinase [Subtercola frigoramans]